ncbi:MAG: carboxypeptidase-like regulatory domain-containing protein [Marinoscillum sp.]
MKKALTIIGLFVVVIVGRAQQSIHGVLLDETSDEAVEFAHVNNITIKEGTITSLKGTFEIKASEGDTIVFSIVGYQRIGWKVKPSWLEETFTLKLPRDTIFLDEVIVNNLPSEEVFKRRILSYEPADTAFWYHGIPKPKPYNNAPLSEKQINNPLFAILQPTDFLYEKFSKSAKEKRKYHQIVTTQTRDQRVYQKFNRDWVKDVTGLDGDELTSFIDYCDYSLEYLDKTELFFIQQDMLAKLTEFKKSEQG